MHTARLCHNAGRLSHGGVGSSIASDLQCAPKRCLGQRWHGENIVPLEHGSKRATVHMWVARWQSYADSTSPNCEVAASFPCLFRACSHWLSQPRGHSVTWAAPHGAVWYCASRSWQPLVCQSERPIPLGTKCQPPCRGTREKVMRGRAGPARQAGQAGLAPARQQTTRGRATPPPGMRGDPPRAKNRGPYLLVPPPTSRRRAWCRL